MTTKLTLTIEEKVIGSVKKYAQKKGKSLSRIVENYLKSIAFNGEDEQELSPKIKKLMGSIKLPQNFDYKKALSKSIAKKYK